MQKASAMWKETDPREKWEKYGAAPAAPKVVKEGPSGNFLVFTASYRRAQKEKGLEEPEKGTWLAEAKELWAGMSQDEKDKHLPDDDPEKAAAREEAKIKRQEKRKAEKEAEKAAKEAAKEAAKAEKAAAKKGAKGSKGESKSKSKSPMKKSSSVPADAKAKKAGKKTKPVEPQEESKSMSPSPRSASKSPVTSVSKKQRNADEMKAIMKAIEKHGDKEPFDMPIKQYFADAD